MNNEPDYKDNLYFEMTKKMQDRFKFRVWNKKSNNYIKEKMFYIDKFGGLFKYEKSKSTVYINAPSPYVMCLCGDNYIVEQCTGLKDKNGKLIYEGDICRITGKYWDCEDAEEKSVNEIDTVKSLEEFFGEAMVKGIYTALFCETLKVEVIGNIHENADLLEADNAD